MKLKLEEEADSILKPNQIPTMFTSALYVAILFSSLVASWVTQMLGQRQSMLSCGVLFCAGALINGLAQNVAMLIVGRILLGFGIGFGNQVVPLYLSKMALYKYRGSLNFCFQLSITLGILIANLLNYWFAKIEGGWGWRLSLGGAIVPALIRTVGLVFLPEIPNSLIEMGKQDQAKSELLKICSVDNVDEEFKDLVAASETSKKVEHPWRNPIL